MSAHELFRLLYREKELWHLNAQTVEMTGMWKWIIAWSLCVSQEMPLGTTEPWLCFVSDLSQQKSTSLTFKEYTVTFVCKLMDLTSLHLLLDFNYICSPFSGSLKYSAFILGKKIDLKCLQLAEREKKRILSVI